MIVLFGGTKGGSSKSTITTNIAACMAADGYNVLIMDTDAQCSATRWVERRENKELNPAELPKIHCTQVTGNVYNTALDLEKLYEIVLIDAGGTDSRELRTAMLAADIFYAPLQASQFDLETLVGLDDMVTTARDQNPTLKVFGLLTRASTSPFNDEVKEAKELLAQFPQFTLADSVICDRKAYRDVTPLGRGVVEYKNSQAKAEIQLLAQEIMNVIQ